LDTWNAYYEKMSNEEFVWDKHSLSDMGRVSGPSENISVAEVKAAIVNMKNNKAAGLSWVVPEMLQVSGVEMVKNMFFCDEIFHVFFVFFFNISKTSFYVNYVIPYSSL